MPVLGESRHRSRGFGATMPGSSQTTAGARRKLACLALQRVSSPPQRRPKAPLSPKPETTPPSCRHSPLAGESRKGDPRLFSEGGPPTQSSARPQTRNNPTSHRPRASLLARPARPSRSKLAQERQRPCQVRLGVEQRSHWIAPRLHPRRCVFDVMLGVIEFTLQFFPLERHGHRCRRLRPGRER